MIAVDTTMQGSFDLLDGQGRKVTDEDFRGRFLLVFFGYTTCPDICPTGLQAIGQALELLGTQGSQVQAVFITIDPERDKPGRLDDYVQYYHPGLLGLTGSDEQIAVAAQNYGVLYQKTVVSATDGSAIETTFAHSAFTYLLDRQGFFLAAFKHGSTPGEISDGIRQFLNK